VHNPKYSWVHGNYSTAEGVLEIKGSGAGCTKINLQLSQFSCVRQILDYLSLMFNCVLRLGLLKNMQPLQAAFLGNLNNE